MAMKGIERTMKAAQQAATDRPDVLIKAEEISDVYYARGASPSLLARRTWNLLVKAAAGDAWKAERHSIRKRELCAGWHIGPKEISEVLEELQTTLIKQRITSQNNRSAILTTALLSSTIEETDNDDTSLVWYRFTPELCELLRTSKYYVELEKLVFLSFQCKYSHQLYERAVRKLRDKLVIDHIKLEDLRVIFGIEKGTLTRWQHLKERVIEPAVAEVNHLAPFVVRWQPVASTATKRHNPPVLAVQFTYAPKDTRQAANARAELERSRVGRKARREQTVEQIATEDRQQRAELEADLATLPAPRKRSKG